MRASSGQVLLVVGLSNMSSRTRCTSIKLLIEEKSGGGAMRILSAEIKRESSITFRFLFPSRATTWRQSGETLLPNRSFSLKPLYVTRLLS